MAVDRVKANNEVVQATRHLHKMAHVAEIVGMTNHKVRNLLQKPGAPHDFLGRVRFIVKLIEDDDPAATGRKQEDNMDPAYQQARLRKIQADKAKLDYEIQRRRVAPLEIMEADIRNVAVECARNLDGLLPSIQQILPNMPQSVSDEIETTIAECRNRMADMKLSSDYSEDFAEEVHEEVEKDEIIEDIVDDEDDFYHIEIEDEDESLI